MASETQQEWVLVGLGNPGKKYEMTRHNLGYLTVQALAQELGMNFKEEKRFHGYLAKGSLAGKSLHLLLPTTYMNESGKALRAVLDFYKLSPKHVVVVVDDVELGFGVLRLRPMGSSGGHNGLKSIEAHVNTSHYIRLRMGIGKGNGQESLVDYVLAPFNQEEMAALPVHIAKAAAALKEIITSSLATAMQSVNAKEKTEVKMQTPQNGSGEQKHESN